MAKARRKFKSRAKQPFLFEIDGAEFETARRISGAMFVDFIRLLQGFEGGGGSRIDIGMLTELGDTVHGMFESVMEPEEFSRFWKWARSPDGCDFETLIEVMSEMVADDTDRPTKRPTPSGSGPRTTGDISTED